MNTMTILYLSRFFQSSVTLYCKHLQFICRLTVYDSFSTVIPWYCIRLFIVAILKYNDLLQVISERRNNKNTFFFDIKIIFRKQKLQYEIMKYFWQQMCNTLIYLILLIKMIRIEMIVFRVLLTNTKCTYANLGPTTGLFTYIIYLSIIHGLSIDRA